MQNVARAAERPIALTEARRVVPLAASCLAVICALAVSFAGRGLGDESAVSVSDDTVRYLMNGVFFLDFFRDWPLASPITYAYEYFARYPALSLGHHPVLTSLVEVPFFALFGVSVFSGRLSILCTLVALLVLWYHVVRRIFDTQTALVACLLLATAPGLVGLFQVVHSEPITLCLIAAACWFLQRYCTSDRVRDGLLFIGAVVLSLWAKQLAIVMFPVYAVLFASARGWRALVSQRAIAGSAAIALGALPLVPLTLSYSRFNVALVTDWAAHRTSAETLLMVTRALTDQQFAWPVVLLGLASGVVGVFRRDRRTLLFVFWCLTVFGGLVLLGVPVVRYACYGAPALAVLAATVMHLGRTHRQRIVWGALLVVALGYQITVSAGIEPGRTGGYEAAAKFITGRPVGDAVLYQPSIDPGYFVFFMRKHDENRRTIVLRGDKVLTTSRMIDMEFARRVQRREEILPILDTFGVGYVVVEDRPLPDGPLEWLRQLVNTDRFALRARIPMRSSDPNLQTRSLEIYEYRDRRRADPTARLSLDIPLMDDRIIVTFGDLLRGGQPH